MTNTPQLPVTSNKRGTMHHNPSLLFRQHGELIVKCRAGVPHHDGDLPLVDVQVGHVVDVHPLESAADATVSPGQKHHGETSWNNTHRTHKAGQRRPIRRQSWLKHRPICQKMLFGLLAAA